MQAQSVKVIRATSQGWAGGICCKHGVKYVINLKVIRSKQPITLDTLWLEGFARDMSDQNKKKLNRKDTLSIQISDGISYDDGLINIDKNPDVFYDGTKTGVILVYRINNKRMELNISPFIEDLGFLAYP